MIKMIMKMISMMMMYPYLLIQWLNNVFIHCPSQGREDWPTRVCRLHWQMTNWGGKINKMRMTEVNRTISLCLMLMTLWFVMMEAMMADYNVIIYTRWWITMGARTPAQPAYLGANIKKIFFCGNKPERNVIMQGTWLHFYVS